MAVNKSKADLLSQAATTLADNTTQAISPQDVREMAENLAESNFNKTTDNALVGLKAYDSGVIYKVSQGVNYNGSLYFANKDTTPGAFNTADWDLFAEQSNVIISGKKASAGTIAKGKPVYLVGFDNDLHTVEEANATAAGTTPVIGFTAEAFDASSSKSIITFGKLTGIDTSAFSVGKDLYLATSAGGLTTTRPTGGGSIVQRIAKVLKSHASTGEILIYNTARAAGLPNLTTNKIWYGNASGQPEELGIGTGLTVTGGNLTAAGGGSIYSQDGTILSNRQLTLTDTVRFKNGSFEIQGAGTSTGKTLVLYNNDSTPAKTWEFLDNGNASINQNSDLEIGANFFNFTNGNKKIGIPSWNTHVRWSIDNGNGVRWDLISANSSSSFNAGEFGIAKGSLIPLRVFDGTRVAVGNVAKSNLDTNYTLQAGATLVGGNLHTKNGTDFSEIDYTNYPKIKIGTSTSQWWIVNSNAGRSGSFDDNDLFIWDSTNSRKVLRIKQSNGELVLGGDLDAGNKRIKNAVINPSVNEAASSATFTINADQQSDGVLTAMAAATTIAAPTGTPVQSQSLVFRFKDDGTARGITWNAIFRAIGVTLPTTTTASKLLYVGCKYNSTDTKWDVVSVQEEA